MKERTMRMRGEITKRKRGEMNKNLLRKAKRWSASRESDLYKGEKRWRRGREKKEEDQMGPLQRHLKDKKREEVRWSGKGRHEQC